MKRLALALALGAAALPAGAEPAPIQTGTGHRFACADYAGGKVFLVGADGAVQWEYPAPHCDELWALPGGNLLFTTGRGVKEVTPEKKVVFQYDSKGEVYACQRLPDGTTFVGECSAGRLLDVDPSGKIVKEVKLLPEGKSGGHAYMRNARRLPNGNTLVAHYGEGVVKEYDPQGKVVLEIRAPGGPHSVARLPNGNTLIAVGDKIKTDAKLFEVDAKGAVVWELANKDLPDAPLKFMTGFHRLPNGNTVASNWLGHGHLGKAPHLFEVTPDKKVVWTYANHKDMKTIASVVILDVPGDPIKGEVHH
jgi:hypothetical protein